MCGGYRVHRARFLSLGYSLSSLRIRDELLIDTIKTFSLGVISSIMESLRFVRKFFWPLRKLEKRGNFIKTTAVVVFDKSRTLKKVEIIEGSGFNIFVR